MNDENKKICPINEENDVNNQTLDRNDANKINTKKKFKLSKPLKIVLSIVFVVLILILTVFGLYKSTVDVAAKNEAKYDYDLSQEVAAEDIQFIDYLSYNSKTNKDIIGVTIPKNIFYNKIIDIHALAKEIKDIYDVEIYRLGTMSNATNPNLIDFCADVNYKNAINAYVSGSIRYEFTSDNGINLYLEKFVVGDGFPMFLYKDFLPIKDGDLIREIAPSEYDLLNTKALDLSCVGNIVLGSESLKFDFNYMNNIDSLAKYLFGDQADRFADTMENVLPIVMEMTFGDNKEEFKEMQNEYIPYIIKQIFLS